MYWLFKWFAFTPAIKLICRPWMEGRENVPKHGAAILVSNHLSAGDPIVLPAMLKRRLTFPAKAELFAGGGLRAGVVKWFLTSVGMVPMDRSGGRASAVSMDSVLKVLADGALIGIYPEGTRSPDGRLYKGKTGVARLVLAAGVPVLPVAMINTQSVRNRFGVPVWERPGIRVGRPLDFTRYANAGNDRNVLRWVTDEIMTAVLALSGQESVDVYASSVKTAAVDGRRLEQRVIARPGLGNPVPPIPVAPQKLPGAGDLPLKRRHREPSGPS